MTPATTPTMLTTTPTTPMTSFLTVQVEALDRHYYYPSTAVSTLAINDLALVSVPTAGVYPSVR
ncbi:hypothetical protein BYT27DRAFT_7264635 [Phlegmacium glaucopus]|nr:hypothetical protein BYT27DRAFT_7264635 [Phlegmacium glaucopus]